MSLKKLDALFERCYKQERQLAFILELWARKDANYVRVADAVSADINNTIREARQHRHGTQRAELLRDLKSMLEVIAFLHRARSTDIWSGATSNHTRPVTSLASAGAPSLGRR